MDDTETWRSVRALLRGGDLFTAIDLIESWLRGRCGGARPDVESWLNELVVHYAGAKAIAVRLRKGLIDEDHAAVRTNRITLSVLELVDLIEASAKAPEPQQPAMAQLPKHFVEGTFEKITGSRSQLRMVNWLDRGVQCSSGVCRLISDRVMGTGFRIGNDLIVTNNHVIGGLKSASGFSAQFFFQERLDRSIDNGIMIALDRDRFWTSPELDITIVGARFDNADARQAPPIAALTLSDDAVTVGDAVSIIQHPMGGPKQIAVTANEIMQVADPLLQYSTDTLPGSSGAPVFDMHWRVIAVHHAGGILVANQKGDHVFANQGVRATAFIDIPAVKALQNAG